MTTSNLELRKQVAVEVMGLRQAHWITHGKYGHPWIIADQPRGDLEGYQRELPAYETDIAAAWQVVEKMREKYHWRIQTPFETKDYHWAGLTPKGVTGWNGRPDFDEKAETAPLAICKAALAAVRASNE